MPRVSLRAGLIGLAALCGLGLPQLAQANTIYTYHGGSPYSLNIVLDLTLSGAALQNLSSGTNVQGSLASILISGPETPFATDLDGNAVGTNNPISGTPVLIGTDGSGNITSWNIGRTFSAFYPGSGSVCGYSVSSQDSGDVVATTSIGGGGRCRLADNVTAPAGTWTQSVAPTPLPSTEAMLATALLALVGLALRRRGRVQAVARAA